MRFNKIADELGAFSERFMTAPSPGIISTTMLNAYYDSHDAYLKAIAREMKNEYQAINKAGLILQIDAPDLAMDRTMAYRDLDDAGFIKAIERHIAALNEGIAGIPRDRVRLHVCYGNWEGPHIHDIPLVKILPVLYQANVGALSIEFSNPRHAHEYAAFKTHPLPKDMLLIPGVVETTSNFVEHPEVVARRIEEAVATVGERERVIAGDRLRLRHLHQPRMGDRAGGVAQARRHPQGRRHRFGAAVGQEERRGMITLYDFGNSVCCQKVRITLREKGLDWEATRVDLFKAEQYDPKYLKLNPKGLVPTLVHDGNAIAESTLICEYIDDAFPDPPLKPADPAARARMRHVEQVRRRGPVRGRHRAQLLGHVPRAHEEHAGRNPPGALRQYRRPAPARPLHVDL